MQFWPELVPHSPVKQAAVQFPLPLQKPGLLSKSHSSGAVLCPTTSTVPSLLSTCPIPGEYGKQEDEVMP